MCPKNSVPLSGEESLKTSYQKDSLGIHGTVASERRDTTVAVEHALSKNILCLKPECAQVIDRVICNLPIPIKKENVLLPIATFAEIYHGLSSEPAIQRVKQVIQDELIAPLGSSKGNAKGYLIVDGLYPPEIYPDGINPQQHTSAELAPFDSSKNRAYEFDTDLMQKQLKAFVAFSCLTGVPFRMFDAKNLIIPVTAHAAVQASKFGGQGPNFLHKDGGFLVPRPSNDPQNPSMGPGTEISSLLCINPDKHGMGISWIVTEDTQSIIDTLEEREREMLQAELFHYMPTHGLNDAEGLKRFSVLYKNRFGEWALRFSGKLREHMDQHWDQETPAEKEDVLGTLEKVHDALMDNKKDILLFPGQMLCMNQHITFHGRNEVQDSNRLLAQLFNRHPYHGGSLLADQYAAFSRNA